MDDRVPTGSFPQKNMDNRMLPFAGFMGERPITMGNPITLGNPITYGPWGGCGGTTFDDGMYTGIRQINLKRFSGICSIHVLYDMNGHAVWGKKHGYIGSLATCDEIIFDFPTEILTHITGYIGTTLWMGPTVIKSLTFYTNIRKLGPFGKEYGRFFSSCLNEGRVIGFHGREGWYIDSIGVHIFDGGNAMHAYRSAYGMLREPVPTIGYRPCGGYGGNPWDDGIYSGIKQILITRGKFIHSIQIEYECSDGQSVWSCLHGGTGERSHKIKFNFPNEVLNCIAGYYSSNQNEGSVALRSISLYSNRGKYGPFGEEVGTYFTSGTTEGKVVGFYGRSGLYLNSIGVHMQHSLGETRFYCQGISSGHGESQSQPRSRVLHTGTTTDAPKHPSGSGAWSHYIERTLVREDFEYHSSDDDSDTVKEGLSGT